MSIGRRPRNNKDRSLGDNAVSLRHPDDEFFDWLSPVLQEAATDEHNVSRSQALLAKENARLRALAVELSNLLGDLPVREWDDAAQSYRSET